MTWAGFWCVLLGGGTYEVVGKGWVPAPTDEEWARDPRSKERDGAGRPKPKPTGYYWKYEALCTRCHKDIATHL